MEKKLKWSRRVKKMGGVLLKILVFVLVTAAAIVAMAVTNSTR